MYAAQDARLYAHVSVWFWPWLWWQLRLLKAWINQTGTGVIVAVDRRGNLRVTYVADDETSLIPVPLMPLRYQEALQDVPFGVSMIPVGMGQAMERYGARLIWLAALDVVPAPPRPQDSS